MLVDINSDIASKLALLAEDNKMSIEEYTEHLLIQSLSKMQEKVKTLKQISHEQKSALRSSLTAA